METRLHVLVTMKKLVCAGTEQIARHLPFHWHVWGSSPLRSDYMLSILPFPKYTKKTMKKLIL